jgi:hypothetical protein
MFMRVFYLNLSSGQRKFESQLLDTAAIRQTALRKYNFSEKALPQFDLTLYFAADSTSMANRVTLKPTSGGCNLRETKS